MTDPSCAPEDLEALLDAVPDFVAWLDRDCRYLRVNRAYEVGFGWRRSDLIGRTILDTFGSCYFNFIQPYVARVLAGETLDFETQAYAPEGQTRHLAVRYTPRRSTAGTVEGFIAVVRDVTREKQSEQAIRESAERFAVALKNTRTSVFEHDSELRYTWLHNQEDASFTDAAVIGKTDLEVLPEPYGRELFEKKRAVLNSWEAVKFEYELPLAGKTESFQVTIEPIVDRAGAIAGLRGSAVNVTDLRQVERRLRVSEDKYRRERERFASILEQAPIGITVLRGEELTIEMANPIALQVLPGRDLIGKTVAEAVPELTPEFFETLRSVLRTGKPFKAREMRFELDRDNDGRLEPCWFDLVYHPMTNSAGVRNSILSLATEVTDKVLAVRDLQQQKIMFDTALSNTSDYMYIFDEDGRFLYANRPFTELFNMPLEQVIGKRLHDIELYQGGLGDALVEQIRKVIASRKDLMEEVEFRGANGEVRLYEYTFRAVVENDGSVRAVAGSSRDITESQRNARQLRAAVDELRRKNRELEEFAYVSSHDLQEPIRTVNVYTQLLLRRIMGGDEKAQQYGAFIQSAVGRMNELIRDLLSFSRVVHEENKGPDYARADLAEAFVQALDSLKVTVEETRATVSVGPLPEVSGDTAQLSHVFQNLLSNALKYRKPDHSPIIEVRCESAEDGYLVKVRDNGIGFEPQYADRIFGLFKRLHRDEYPGTGLGLAICQRIVERFGGRIWAESTPGEGSTFCFTLRAAPAVNTERGS